MRKQIAAWLRRQALHLDPGVVVNAPFKRLGEPSGPEFGVVSTILHVSYQAYFVMARGRVLVWSTEPLSREEWRRIRLILMENRWAGDDDLTLRLSAMLDKPITAEVEGRNWSRSVSFPVSR